MSIVSPAVEVATRRAAMLAESGNVPKRVKVAGSSHLPVDLCWPRMIAIDIDDAVQQSSDGKWAPDYRVYHFSDDMRIGKGCDQCLQTGRIGVYVHDEFDPYLCERCCPNCDSDH